jgi:DNA-binding Lrp family transcriptional regulator
LLISRQCEFFLAQFAIREYRIVMLKGQDIVVLLKIIARNDAELSFARLAVELEMSSSEVHAAVKRAVKSGLMQVEANAGASHRKSTNRHALLEFLIHGLKYVFPAERGGETRGMPTALFAPNVPSQVVGTGPVSVWPDPTGEVRGYEFRPLFRSVPAAAKHDDELYVLLALVDAIRGGSARERNIAVKELTRKLVGNKN